MKIEIGLEEAYAIIVKTLQVNGLIPPNSKATAVFVRDPQGDVIGIEVDVGSLKEKVNEAQSYQQVE